MSESKIAVLKAMNALMKEVEFVPKEKVPQLKYETVSYDGLLDQIREKALEHGLLMIPSDCQHTNCTPYERAGYEGKNVHMKCDNYVFTFTIWHVSGEYLIVKAPGIGVDEQDKGPGKALTYATKNAWLKALMLKTGDDPDLEASRGHQTPQNQQRPPQQPQQQSRTQQPANNAQKPTSGKLTDDPSTWPPDWQKALDAGVASAKNVKEIEAMEDFRIMNVLTKVKEQVMSKSPSDIITNVFLHKIAGWTLDTAMRTTHAKQVVDDVLGNWDLFEEYIGPGEKANAIKKKLVDWVPF